MVKNHKPVPPVIKSDKTTQYQAIIGPPIYVTVGAGPDIPYAITFLAKFPPVENRNTGLQLNKSFTRSKKIELGHHPPSNNHMINRCYRIPTYKQ